MTLENLLRIGRLKAQPVDEVQVARLLDGAELAVRDAAVEGLSAISRLDIAWRAIMQASLAALLANGYRPSTSEPGHHQMMVHALPKTIGMDPRRVQVLDAFRKMRNQVDYHGVPVSDAVAAECGQAAARLIAEVRAWRAARQRQPQ
jgi:hypothetical protein